VAQRLGAPAADDLEPRLEELLARQRELAREVEALQSQLAGARAGSLTESVIDVDGIPLLAARVDVPDAAALRGQIDVLRPHLPTGVIVLGAVIDGAPRVVAAVSDDLVARGLHAGNLIKALATRLGGGGGGRPGLAEAGGRDATALDGALAGVAEEMRKGLGS
jgi:alanyl-tRNA synthetase